MCLIEKNEAFEIIRTLLSLKDLPTKNQGAVPI